MKVMTRDSKLLLGGISASFFSLLVLFFINSFGVEVVVDGGAPSIEKKDLPEIFVGDEFENYKVKSEQMLKERIEIEKKKDDSLGGTFFFLKTRLISLPFILLAWVFVFYFIRVEKVFDCFLLSIIPAIFAILGFFGIIEFVGGFIAYLIVKLKGSVN